MDDSVPDRPTCSVVIPVLNAADVLPFQLEALAAQTYAEPFEVVIADNGSTDDLAAVIRDWQERVPGLRVVDAARKRGISVARNDGVRAARGEMVVICDGDDVVSPEWVDGMVAALRDNDFVGGALRVLRSSADDWAVSDDTVEALPLAYGDVPVPPGGNLGIRTELFNRVGGFDEAFESRSEEIDFALRVADAGVTAVFVPDALIWYRMRPDLSGLIKQQYRSGKGNAQLFLKHRPAGVSTRSWHRRIRHEWALISRFPRSRNREDWFAYAAQVAFESGMAVVALRARRPVP